MVRSGSENPSLLCKISLTVLAHLITSVERIFKKVYLEQGDGSGGNCNHGS